MYACAYLCECVSHVCPWRPQEGIGASGTGVKGSCYRLIDLGSLEKQQVHLTTAAPFLKEHLEGNLRFCVGLVVVWTAFKSSQGLVRTLFSLFVTSLFSYWCW